MSIAGAIYEGSVARASADALDRERIETTVYSRISRISSPPSRPRTFRARKPCRSICSRRSEHSPDGSRFPPRRRSEPHAPDRGLTMRCAPGRERSSTRFAPTASRTATGSTDLRLPSPLASSGSKYGTEPIRLSSGYPQVPHEEPGARSPPNALSGLGRTRPGDVAPGRFTHSAPTAGCAHRYP